MELPLSPIDMSTTLTGLCGLSMGGVHACMTAGLYPLDDLAVVPLLAPRSAAVAYIDGAMRVRGLSNKSTSRVRLVICLPSTRCRLRVVA